MPTLVLLTAIEPNPERTLLIPEPMASGRRNERQLGTAQCRVEIDAANALQKLLLQEPFLHPVERRVLVLDGDGQRRLVDDPEPEALRKRAQVCDDSADDHQEQAARSKLVLAVPKVL